MGKILDFTNAEKNMENEGEARIFHALPMFE